jgi:hypothetical protein
MMCQHDGDDGESSLTYGAIYFFHVRSSSTGKTAQHGARQRLIYVKQGKETGGARLIYVKPLVKMVSTPHSRVATSRVAF